ncbi:hypothetical protein ACOSQ2_013438 [Xanthoceras sorbifolium]
MTHITSSNTSEVSLFHPLLSGSQPTAPVQFSAPITVSPAPIQGDSTTASMHCFDVLSPITTAPAPMATSISSSPMAGSSTQSTASPAHMLNCHPMQIQSKAGIFKPKAWLAMSVETEPRVIVQALQNPLWVTAMEAEF